MGIIVENSRVVGNTAATLAGGIYVFTTTSIVGGMYVDPDSTLRVTSTTVAGNRAGNGGE